MKKILFNFMVFSIIVGCKQSYIENKANDVNERTSQEIQLPKGKLKEKKIWENYYDKLNEILEISNIDGFELTEVDRIYEFRINGEYDGYCELIEILDLASLDTPQFKKIRYTVNSDCNPLIGFKQLSKECVKIYSSYEGNLDRGLMDSLNQFVLDNEFWELTEEESEIRNYDDILYHGESWSMKGIFAKKYRLGNDKDTLILKEHEVYRLIPEDSRSLFTIGNRILNEVKRKN